MGKRPAKSLFAGRGSVWEKGVHRKKSVAVDSKSSTTSWSPTPHKSAPRALEAPGTAVCLLWEQFSV